jgi:hypothetical protein
MAQYDFLNLSPSEFENLTRDLFQKEFNTHIESFTEGTDGGIDLRFAKFDGGKCIVQCKRFSTDFNSLYNNLKKEIPKIRKLNPTDYYVSTSVGLTPDRKKKIVDLLSPFIKNDSNIFGRDDLNNLLGKYPEIEKKHYKLWLSSTNILEKILHSKIYNQGQFELEKIKETIKIYVQNESFNECLSILENNKFVIISGIPGIGKTTLARILVYHLLANGFEEFIFLSNSIAEGYKVFHEGKKQIFLFDDFLGRNFLETNKFHNEDQEIIRFVEKIRKSKNKILIFTTREYILNQAKQKYESFNNPYFDKNKCIVDLSKYTKFVKAQILCNHLFFSELPNKYLQQILKDNFYLNIINHRNYSPRIIEVVTQNWDLGNDKSVDFQKKLKSFFDNPYHIWEHAYDNQISNLSKYILAILLTTGTPILNKDLLTALQVFAEKLSNKYRLSYSEQDFNKALKELENTFIITNKDNKHEIGIDYQNPSIQDFLVNHIAKQKDLIKDLLNNAIYYEQFMRVFSFYDELTTNKGEIIKITNKIFLDKEIAKSYCEKILNDFDNLKSCGIRRVINGSVKSFNWENHHSSDYQKLSELLSKIYTPDYPLVRNFIKDRFIGLISDLDFDFDTDDLNNFINLFRAFKEDISIDVNSLLTQLSYNFYCYDDLFCFLTLREFFLDEFSDFVLNDPDFKETLLRIAEHEYYFQDDSDLEDALEIFRSLERNFHINTSFERMEIEDKIEERDELQNDISMYAEEHYEDEKYVRQNEDAEIKSMFDSLKDFG